jgi:glycosyltransferase involved in cell wall biosynthesis
LKVVHLSSSDLSGGASIACKRISDSLILENVDSNLLVQKKSSPDDKVQSTTNNFLSRLHYNLRFALDEGYIRLLTNQKRGRFSYPFIGIDITNHPLIISSDVINLHWINGGFLSLDILGKIGKLGKPIVWTLHDMWAFTGGCHYSLDCRKFEKECNYCPLLKQSGKNDKSNKIFSEKKFFKELNLTIVTCSKWLKQEAERSALLGEKKILNIPNPLDTEFYKPSDIILSRKKLGLSENKICILFGAMNLIDERKGFGYLLNSLNKLASESPDNKDKIEILVFGKTKDETLNSIPFKCHYFGNLKSEDEIIACYNSADIFIAPSLQDNLPNTVVESLACGTPVVSFNVGGLPDMIDHLKNGYLAQVGSVEDLVNGINWYINNPANHDQLRLNARERAVKNFSREVVAKQYKELYRSIIKN